MIKFDKLKTPKYGDLIEFTNDGKIKVPNNPIIPYIEGDGIGPDITNAMKKVLDGAVETCFGGSKKIIWLEIFAGEKANDLYGEFLPNDTYKAIKHFKVAIKGPLTTPVGGGFRSLNVTLRQKLDLYQCIRPVRHIKGVSAPVRSPDDVDITVFRENIEDVYAGIEWEEGSTEAKKLIDFLSSTYGITIRSDSGIGIKPISEFGSKRLVRAAINYAVKYGYHSVTLMHKGNIMKYTEGSFRKWGYEVAKEEFEKEVINEHDLYEKYDGILPKGKILIKDRIADSMFQQVLLRPKEYDIVACPNLNGDYLSDALAAQVGGLGLAPGANVGDNIALFEATHGTAPKYAGMDKVNPTSLILSGAMMLKYMEWDKCASIITSAIESTIEEKKVTYDLARQMDGVDPVKTSEFADALVKNMEEN